MAKKQVEGIIYCYTNKINNKKYIGQTTDESSRKTKFHTQEEYCTSHKSGGRLFPFLIMLGKNTELILFIYEVLERVISEDFESLHLKLDELERFYINKYDSYNNVYNSNTGGISGWIDTEETRHLMSKHC